MKKHEDPTILKQIKLWVQDADRPRASHLAQDISYSDFNKFWKYLLRCADARPDQLLDLIDSTAQEIEGRNMKITKKCFKSVANYVFDITPQQVLELEKYIPGHGDIWDSFAQLHHLTSEPSLLAEGLLGIKRDFILARSELNRKNLESVLLAGMVVYLCSCVKDHLPVSENLTESVCIPVIQSMGLPASESSVSRYRKGFDALIAAMSPAPEPAFSLEWNTWWIDFKGQIKALSCGGPSGFVRYAREIELLPGAKKLLIGLPIDGSDTGDEPAPGLTSDEKVLQKVEHFRALSSTKKRKTILRTIDKLYLDIQFLSQVDTEEEGIRCLISNLQKIEQELKSVMSQSIRVG